MSLDLIQTPAFSFSRSTTVPPLARAPNVLEKFSLLAMVRATSFLSFLTATSSPSHNGKSNPISILPHRPIFACSLLPDCRSLLPHCRLFSCSQAFFKSRLNPSYPSCVFFPHVRFGRMRKANNPRKLLRMHKSLSLQALYHSTGSRNSAWQPTDHRRIPAIRTCWACSSK
jgi:hypothetical protein